MYSVNPNVQIRTSRRTVSKAGIYIWNYWLLPEIEEDVRNGITWFKMAELQYTYNYTNQRLIIVEVEDVPVCWRNCHLHTNRNGEHQLKRYQNVPRVFLYLNSEIKYFSYTIHSCTKGPSVGKWGKENLIKSHESPNINSPWLIGSRAVKDFWSRSIFQFNKNSKKCLRGRRLYRLPRRGHKIFIATDNLHLLHPKCALC